MRKIYFLLACFFCSLLLHAQTTNQVDFAFATDSISNKVEFTNTSVLQTDNLPKKAFWSFGNGVVAITTALAGVTYHYPLAGTYQACLKIYKYNPNNPADSTLLGSTCKTVTVQQRCEAGFQWTDSLTSLGHFVKFLGGANNNGNKPVKEVCWTFGDGTDTCILASAGATPSLNITHKYARSGTYTVCMRVKFDGGCVAERCKTVVLSGVSAPDSCTANFLTQPVTATPLARKFFAQPWHSAGKKPVRICWTFGDGKDTCIQYPANYSGDYWVQHNYAQYGNYEVCVTIKYDGGCEKKKCNQVIVTQPSDCSIDVNEVAVNTASLERKFYVGLMQNRVAERLCWIFGDGTDTCITLSSPLNAQQLMIVHHYPAPGNYTVCAKVTYAGGCTVQRCRQVSITLPYTNLCGGYMTDSSISISTIRFKGTGIHAPADYVTAYNWNFGDGTTGTGQTITHAYAVAGRYNVCLSMRTASGCETKICKAVGTVVNSQPQLILTPNPVTTLLNATFTSLLQQTMTVKIYNANGLMVRSYVRTASVGTNNWTFSDVGTLPIGVYSMIVQSANQFATAIFFKQ